MKDFQLGGDWSGEKLKKRRNQKSLILHPDKTDMVLKEHTEKLGERVSLSINHRGLPLFRFCGSLLLHQVSLQR